MKGRRREGAETGEEKCFFAVLSLTRNDAEEMVGKLRVSPQNKGQGPNGAHDPCILHFSTPQTKERKKASFAKYVHFSEAVKIIIFIDNS